jgi:hypothetical protein
LSEDEGLARTGRFPGRAAGACSVSESNSERAGGLSIALECTSDKTESSGSMFKSVSALPSGRVTAATSTSGVTSAVVVVGVGVRGSVRSMLIETGATVMAASVISTAEASATAISKTASVSSETEIDSSEAEIGSS